MGEHWGPREERRRRRKRLLIPVMLLGGCAGASFGWVVQPLAGVMAAAAFVSAATMTLSCAAAMWLDWD